MNFRDSIARLEALGPYEPPTPEQVTKVGTLLADQPDAGVLLDMIFGGAV